MKIKKLLSSVEKIIYDKYGKIGLIIYHSCDGKNGTEIMKKTGVNKSKLVEVLDFLNEQGIIGLHHKDHKFSPS